MAQENLRLGNTVIADSVNPWELTRKAWNRVAEEIGAKFINIEIVCTNAKEHQARVENRSNAIPGLKAPTWEEVQNRDYHPWTGSRFRLDTSGQSIEASLQALLAYVETSLMPRP